MSTPHDVMDRWVKEHGGNRPISRILVANNGLGAAKAIRSMRRWAYETFRKDGRNILHFVVMATPEDIGANAEYIRLADEFVHVPGGSNKNNYANVELVVKVARHIKADAVWPGWGHASENPKLPLELAAHDIIFLGPPAEAMDAVGDKICANLLAQSVGVNVIPWSGSGLTVPDITIPPDTLRQATLETLEEALECVKRVGFPCMVKASEGGGGKGIRKVTNVEEMKVAFPQVQAEVPGSPIFIQKLAVTSRHLEVQVVADKHGNAISLYGRDCSVQRRHQKIIEEGPMSVAPRPMQIELEEGAVRLAKKVGYQSAGTVEYLYNMETDETTFLEVNPRLQVEHPVTEAITGVNIPSVQLQVAMGLPLYRIADIRAYFGADPAGTDVIDFTKATSAPPRGHCMAARITAEDPESGFKPSSGAIHELNYRSVPGVTGNFSVGVSGSGVHQFADSQFGHIFALAPTRDDAGALLVQALSELSIRGEISTNVKYLQSLIEKPEFAGDKHDTAWLDGLIAAKDAPARISDHVAVICGAVMVADENHQAKESVLMACLERGIAPDPNDANLSEHKFELIYNDNKYSLSVTMGGPTHFYIVVNDSMVQLETVKLPDGGLKVLLDGRTHLLYKEESKVGLKLHVDGWTCEFPDDFDPTIMTAPSTGKLIGYLVPDGGYVKEGEPYCEIEVMKTVMPLIATSTGNVTHDKTPGAPLETGDILVRVQLEDPSAVKTVEHFSGTFPSLTPRGDTGKEFNETHCAKFQFAAAGVRRILAGYDCIGDPLSELLSTARSPMMVVDDFAEQCASVSGRCTPAALEELQELKAKIREVCTSHSSSSFFGKMEDVTLAVSAVQHFVDKHGDKDYQELVEFIRCYDHGLYAFECRMLCSFIDMYLDVEEIFSQEGRFEDALISLGTKYKDDLIKVAAFAHSHSKLSRKNAMLLQILEEIDRHGMMEQEICHDKLARLVVLQGSNYIAVAQRAKEIIIRKQETARIGQRKWKMITNKIQSIPQDAVLSSANNGADYTADRRRGSVHASEEMSNAAAAATAAAAAAATGEEGDPLASRGRRHRRGSDSIVALSSEFGSTSSVPNIIKFTYESVFMMDNPEHQIAAIKDVYAGYGIKDVVCTTYTGVVKLDVGIASEMAISGPQFVVENLDRAVGLMTYLSANTSSMAVTLFVRAPELAELDENGTAQHLLNWIYDLKTKKCLGSELVVMYFSVLVPGKELMHFAFLHGNGATTWMEIMPCRGIPPVLAAHWEVERMAGFTTRRVTTTTPSHPGHDGHLREDFSKPDYRIGVFLAEEKLAKSKAGRDRRIFIRTVIYNKDTLLPPTAPDSDGATKPLRTLSGYFGPGKDQVLPVDHVRRVEQVYRPSSRANKQVPVRKLDDDSVLADVISTLELAVGKERTAWNYIFINMVGSKKDDIDLAEEAVQAFLAQCSQDLRRLKVAWIEVKVGPGRLVAYNPTGYNFKVEFHLDAKPRMAYPVLNRIQRKRMVAQNLNSTYCYDFIDIFGYYSRMAWADCANDQIVPTKAWHSIEMVLNSEGMLEEIERPTGQNDVGVVCWRCTMLTPAYPEGRDFILVANDITHMSGSFSPDEDAVYAQAFKVAIEERIPCVYISANSGARIGLDELIKAAFKAAWNDPADPGKGWKYIYLSDEDYTRLNKQGPVKATRIEDAGEVRWQISDVVGGVGVECLQGSGTIASITSKAYQETLTLTYVTGRSVGIGAYCARLSNRIIQQQDAPLILTGSSALNKLLGREVYTSNTQIGGPKVMGPNGVSQLVVPDDLRGVKAIVQWLSYTPKMRGGPLPYVATADPISRPIGYVPPSAPYDPREMLQSFFDSESFMECMPEWGKTVVTGRARLGGLPIGVVAVETRATEKQVPADPGFAGSQTINEQQAGQVWFPDSAFKTAQIIADLNNEGLPLMIFANWRGFAGGLRDMFGEILKYGSYIVDQLRVYRQPIIVYIPHGGELRGGAWVVIDATINPDQMEFFASDSSKGGVLEPEGIVDIKFRRDDLIKTMRRTCPHLLDGLSPEELAVREKELLPVIKQLAVHFAALHDTPGVMLEKKCVSAVVPWAEARPFFSRQLRVRLAQERLKTYARDMNPDITKEELAVVCEELKSCVDQAAEDASCLSMDMPEVSIYMSRLRFSYNKSLARKLCNEDHELVKETLSKTEYSTLD